MSSFFFSTIHRQEQFDRELASVETPEDLTVIRTAVCKCTYPHPLRDPENGFMNLHEAINERADQMNYYFLESGRGFRRMSEGQIAYKEAQNKVREMRGNLPVGPDPVMI